MEEDPLFVFNKVSYPLVDLFYKINLLDQI